MKCPSCRCDNPPTMSFCGSCGMRLARECPSCGFANPPEHSFCGKRGASLGGDAVPPPAPPDAFASPHAYTPRHLAEKILTARSALEGERKQVTVLFCDLANSTGLAAPGKEIVRPRSRDDVVRATQGALRDARLDTARCFEWKRGEAGRER